MARSHQIRRTARHARGVVRALVSPPRPPGAALISFANQLKILRERFGGKQLWLACALGCTDAAVSFWERGKRVPHRCTLSRIVYVLMQAGASRTDVAELCRCWQRVAENKPHVTAPPSAKTENNLPAPLFVDLFVDSFRN